jgi:hypothetical protein
MMIESLAPEDIADRLVIAQGYRNDSESQRGANVTGVLKHSFIYGTLCAQGEGEKIGRTTGPDIDAVCVTTHKDIRSTTRKNLSLDKGA